MHAAQKMMDMFQNQFQMRMAATQDKVKKTWFEIQKVASIDISKVAYEPHPNLSEIVPVAVRFKTDAPE